MPDAGSSEAATGPDLAQMKSWGFLSRAWQVSLALTVSTGILHVINLTGTLRLSIGPVLVTPFRAAFIVAWVILIARLAASRQWPRPDRLDALVAALAFMYLVRCLFEPATLSVALNWLSTGVGIFFLVRHGVRDKSDVRLLVFTVAAVALIISLYGIFEYVFKENPLFDDIRIDVIGDDERVALSDQLYRIRSLVGHPNFTAAVLAGCAPFLALALWRRRRLLCLCAALTGAALFLTFGRGSWVITFIGMILFFGYPARRWLLRNLKWIVPATGIVLLILAVDYLSRDEVSMTYGAEGVQQSGLNLVEPDDSPVKMIDSQVSGIKPARHFLYFDVDDDFYRGGHEGLTVFLYYFDTGYGPLKLQYDSWQDGAGQDEGAYMSKQLILKRNTLKWTSAAFYLEDARFEGRQKDGADFRILDDDSSITVDKVVVQKGRMKLVSVVTQQWLSRSGSLSTRLSLFDFSWDVMRDNSLGVGPFNTPGSDGHAVDSLPLTWMMEFGWLGILPLGILGSLLVYEGAVILRKPRWPAAVFFISLVLVLAHGGHLMILYDKPSLVLVSVAAALYAATRAGKEKKQALEISSRECML